MRDVRKRARIFLGLAVGSLVSLATVVSAGSIQTKHKEGLGTYLVDQNGMTLYMSTKDTPDKSVCGTENDCLKKWPLFYIGSGGMATGIDSAELGSLPRDDGKEQTTYKGSPLYYFVNDKAPGDTKGQGLNKSWYVVAP